MSDKTVFCDSCGANSNNLLVLVTRKKVRCYPCLTMMGITKLITEPAPEEIYKENAEDENVS